AEEIEDVYDYNEEFLQKLYEFDQSRVPDGCVGIVPVSLYRPFEDGKMYVSDAGDKYLMDYTGYLGSKTAASCRGGGYQVLIIHTHGTEAYSPEGALYCEPGKYPRSDKKEENVVAIGDIFEEVFESAGIKTLHCEIPIDKESYSDAYTNAAKIIKKYLKEYPTIKFMFDIHRDAIELSDGSKARMVTAVNGKAAAQLMFVVGSDRIVEENVNWRDNLALAVKLQVAMDEKYPGLMRPINIKRGAFNQYYTPLSLLIEVGSDGNCMEEAKLSAALLAKEIAEMIK
ncbi:MAG: stage II sporulation protein P, partial [Clostridia bacterium]|nr:stage II sporulation protein P [Clostridia bacterium]